MKEMNELFTIRDYVRWTISQFNQAGLTYGHGTDSAWDEAVALILHTLYLPHNVNPQILDARLTTSERENLHKVLHRRIHDRIPVPYLTREAWFGELAFYVDERVLIPRSPIAELIENQFQPWIDGDHVTSILDLCTGSGCIGIACAKAFPDAAVDISDISKDALVVAKMNISRHQVDEQVTPFESDLFENLPAKKYDIIVSNPPYVDAEDMAGLPAEYRHEPTLALAAGTDGLDIAIRILKEAPKFLSAQGILIVEVGNSEYALAEKFPEVPFTWLDFQRGGGGIFLLTAEQLNEFKSVFDEI